MRFTVATTLGLSGLAAAAPQAVTAKISPTGAAPPGCTGTVPGKFEIGMVHLSKRDAFEGIPTIKERNECGGEGILVLTLADGILKDAFDRTGYIADNFQFQFDGPPQAGALITAGYSVCGNGSLALGDTTVFYQCVSGSFSNLYDRHWAAQCSPIHITAIPCGSGAAVGQLGDGQIIGTTTVATTIITVLSDGQPQAVPTSVPVPICQIGDGQVQGHTTPCASLPPAPAPTVAPVSQISDGQIQVPPPATIPGGSAPPGPAPPATTLAPPSTTAVVLTPTPAPSAPSAGSSAPPAQAGAGRVAHSSLAALFICAVGAFWLL